MSIFKKYKLSFPIILVMGIIMSILAWRMNINGCPDEPLRYQLAKWMTENGKLPIGFEEEIVSPIWGFSYAFTPYLPAMLSALFMRICSIFTTDAQALLFSARLVSIFAQLACIYVAFSIGDKIFMRKPTVYFIALVVAFWPQLTFVGAYQNNDGLSLLSSLIILDAVLGGAKNNWRTKDMMYLAIGISIGALTYYFGYAWILFAIVGYFYTSHKANVNKAEMYKKAGFITLLVLLFAGWYFIRNAVIYDGDFLGFRQSEVCAEMYAESHGVELVQNPGRNTMDMRNMLFGSGEWMKMTVRSFIGLFGGLVIELKGKMYLFYYLFILAFVALFFGSFIAKKSYTKLALLLGFVFVMVFPIVFSIYSSYTRDFSPQGRYIITIIPALAFIMAEGFEYLLSLFSKKLPRLYNWITGLTLSVWILMFSIIVLLVMLPLLAEITIVDIPIEFYHIR